jgi:hypothetical protein
MVIPIRAGATRIVLVGYDMCYPGSVAHWHPEHPVVVPEGVYTNVYAPFFERFPTPAGVEILNASPISRIRKFRKVTLEEVFGE